MSFSLSLSAAGSNICIACHQLAFDKSHGFNSY